MLDKDCTGEPTMNIKDNNMHLSYVYRKLNELDSKIVLLSERIKELESIDESNFQIG